jgi:hypothetical protein
VKLLSSTDRFKTWADRKGAEIIMLRHKKDDDAEEIEDGK